MATDASPEIDLLREVTAHLDECLWVRDVATGHVMYVSSAVESLYGVTPEQVMYDSHVWLQAVHPDDREQVRAMQRRQDAGETTDHDYRVVRPDGSVRWVNVKTYVVRGEDGQLLRVCGVSRDITDRRNAEEALRRSEALAQRRLAELQTLYATAPVGLCFVDTDLRFVSVNEALAELNGQPVDAHIGRTLREAVPQLADTIEPLYRQVIETGEPIVDFELRGRTSAKQGADRTWLVGYTPVKDASGTVLGVNAMIQDITERREHEKRLAESERHYREAAESNRRLLDEVNHRVRNNLAGLLALITMMRGRTTDIDVFVEALRQRLTAMNQVHGLLAQAAWQDVDLRRLIQSVFTPLSGAEVHGELCLDGPAVRITPRQSLPLAMTLLEMFTNSIKYGACGAANGTVSVRWEFAAINGTGPGLRLQWVERGGPPITAPIGRSLGTDLIEGFVQYELRGRCELRYPPEGATHEIEFPLDPSL